ncbi:hypothetical protein pb186bvf_010078 [Paramecium bursaria]
MSEEEEITQEEEQSINEIFLTTAQSRFFRICYKEIISQKPTAQFDPRDDYLLFNCQRRLISGLQLVFPSLFSEETNIKLPEAEGSGGDDDE